MKISEMIEELQETMKWNGDQDVSIMIYGKRFDEIELMADEDELYIEGYISDNKEENLFIRHYVYSNEWRQKGE